jgi:hypothetical protein
MSDATPRRVYVVVDRTFGEELWDLEPGVGGWIVGSPINKAVVQRIWKERPTFGHLNSLTVFDDSCSASSEELLLGQLDAIDRRFGAHSAQPAYSGMEVIGTPLSALIESALSSYHFAAFEATDAGFIATRTESLGSSAAIPA